MKLLLPIAVAALLIVFLCTYVPPSEPKKEGYCSSCMMK